MANAPYSLGLQAFLEGSVAYLSDNIKVALLSATYAPNLATDQFYSIIPGGAVIGTPGLLATKTSTLGVANAANQTFSSVASGSTVTQFVIYKDTGSSATSPLLVYFNVATNLPCVTNGGDIAIQWDTGANKIFALCEALPAESRLAAFLRWLRGSGRSTGDRVLGGGRGLWFPEPRIVLAKGVS